MPAIKRRLPHSIICKVLTPALKKVKELSLPPSPRNTGIDVETPQSKDDNSLKEC